MRPPAQGNADASDAADAAAGIPETETEKEALVRKVLELQNTLDGEKTAAQLDGALCTAGPLAPVQRQATAVSRVPAAWGESSAGPCRCGRHCCRGLGSQSQRHSRSRLPLSSCFRAFAARR